MIHETFVMNTCQEIHSFEDDKYCIFCKRNTSDEFALGKIYKKDAIFVHYYCLLFASYLKQNGEDEEGILGFLIPDILKEVRSKEKTFCKYCHKPGATVICATTRCRIKFHFPCGIENNSQHIFSTSFWSHCKKHRRRQRPAIPKSCNVGETCRICLSEITPSPSPSNIWAPCCKTAWFHRECIQRLALSCGYFFKCPNCNSYDVFRKEMIFEGIYIPDQDATWEVELGAFSDLMESRKCCDAENCFYSEGRTESKQSGPWKIILCDACGINGTHRDCITQPFTKKRLKWHCDVCTPAITPVKKSCSPICDKITATNQRKK